MGGGASYTKLEHSELHLVSSFLYLFIQIDALSY